MTRNVSANTALSMRNYGYDHVGNRVAMQDFNGTHSYTYDNGYRLTGASHPNDTLLTNRNETYAYDEVGSRTSDNELGSYSHNAGNQLVENSSYTYTYDNNGNLTRKTSKANSEQVNYTYNSQNQLTRVQMPNGIQVDFKYDLFGHRVEKVVSTTTVTTTRYVYNGEDIIGILDGNNNVVSRVIHGPGVDEPLMIRSGTNEAYLYADGLGSIIAVADANATLQETVEYQAYGKAIYKDAVSGSTATVSYTGNPYGYTGREPDAETGLCYYRARYYDAEAGRFIQADPIAFQGGDTNLYAYVGNSPVRYFDSNGLLRTDEQLGNNEHINNYRPLGGVLVTIYFLDVLHPVIAVPDNSGKIFYLEFGPNVNSIPQLLRALAGGTVSGYVGIRNLKPTDYIVSMPISFMLDAGENEKIIRRAKKLAQEARKGRYNYSWPRNNCINFAVDILFGQGDEDGDTSEP